MYTLDGKFSATFLPRVASTSAKTTIITQVAANAEADVGAAARRILLMEDDAEKSENRLAAAIRKGSGE